MLLPDNINPKLSIYYNGALILKELTNNNNQDMIILYQQVNKKYDLSFPVYLLCLDWLYLVDAANVDDKGVVKLCSSKQ